LHRRIISRAGTLFARTVLLLPQNDLTGGFKAWRRELLEALQSCVLSANGYGFQIETTWWAQRCGARIAEVPITFSERVAGASKMSPDIAREAVSVVLRLRCRQLVAALMGSRTPLPRIASAPEQHQRGSTPAAGDWVESPPAVHIEVGGDTLPVHHRR